MTGEDYTQRKGDLMNKEATIEIDMDKPCTKCGQMGATAAGVCLECATDAAVYGPLDMVKKAIDKGAAQLYQLLAAIGMTIDLAPSDEMPDAIVVRSKINFIEARVRDEKTSRVSPQQKLAM